MRAVTYAEYGPPEVLSLTDVPEPHAGTGQVRIAVEAVSVNAMDWKQRSGMFAEGPLRHPRIPGFDAAGVVDEVGDGVEGVAVGDRVFGSGPSLTAEHGVLRDYAAVPAALTAVQAAALPTAVETSARVLDLLALPPGALLVVDNAAGGVGTALVQLALSRGLRVVGTASVANHDLLRRLGAIPTTYGHGLPGRVRELTPDPVAGAADLAGRGSVPELIELTGDPAQVVSIADFTATEHGARVTDGSEGRAYYALDEVAALVARGAFEVIVERVLPWTRAAEAHELSQSGHARGKIVLTVDRD